MKSELKETSLAKIVLQEHDRAREVGKVSKYTLIVEYLKGFESTLDGKHELALKFSDYGGPYLLLSTQNGKDEFISFELLSDTGESLAVIQSYSQLNFIAISNCLTLILKIKRGA